MSSKLKTSVFKENERVVWTSKCKIKKNKQENIYNLHFTNQRQPFQKFQIIPNRIILAKIPKTKHKRRQRQDLAFEYNVKKIAKFQSAHNPKKKDYQYLVKISPEGTIFKFNSEENQTSFGTLINQVKSGKIMGKSDYQSDLLVIKYTLLQRNPGLQEVYQRLVLSKEMTETEFWKDRIELKEYLQGKEEEKQKVGKQTQILCFKKNSTAESAEKITFTENDIDKIFHYYPKLKSIYDREVPAEFPKKKFWERFWKEQIKYQTELVGGYRKAQYNNQQIGRDLNDIEFFKKLEQDIPKDIVFNLDSNMEHQLGPNPDDEYKREWEQGLTDELNVVQLVNRHSASVVERFIIQISFSQQFQ